MKNRGRTFNLKSELLGSLNYLRESANYIYLVIILFVASALGGFFFAGRLGFLDEVLKGLVDRASGLSFSELVIFILQNNLQASVLALGLGIFMGVFPVIDSIGNGVIIGYVLRKSWEVSGAMDFWKLVPHGIFELPAVFISFGLGIKLGWGFVQNYFKRYNGNAQSSWGLVALMASVIGVLLLFAGIGSMSVLQKGAINIVLGIILIVPFVFMFFVRDRKLRAMQKNTFVHRFYYSALTVLLVVLPLLIIAAVIEGLLIAFLR